MNILHIASECFPLVKTGGLADVVAALPQAQVAAGDIVRVLLPAYRGVAATLEGRVERGTFVAGPRRFTLLEGQLPGTALTVWLLDCPPLFDRAGDPYHDTAGTPHADNPERFARFAEAAATIATAEIAGFKADIVHAHDWQAALVPAWLADAAHAPPSVLTIHNLAYQGAVDRPGFEALALPPAWWHPEVGEFYGQFSFLKCGLAKATALTTVSPTYAREITTPESGMGLDGLLRARGAALTGILNGIDVQVWNPARDPHLPRRYDQRNFKTGKAANKKALQAALQLADDADALLVGIVSRFAHQKGIDAVLAAAPQWRALPVQLVALGAGEPALEAGFAALAAAHPGQVAYRRGYDEALAHRIEAAADAFLMPSRFEPCGMNQMYSQVYGTVPLVRRVGGLADTVVPTSEATLAAGSATGIAFADCDAGAVAWALGEAVRLFRTPHWTALQQRGMAMDFSWQPSATAYAALYRSLHRAR